MIVGFSTMVYAQKLEFKASGSIDFATVWEMNVPFYFASVSVNQAGHTGLFQTWTTPSFYASTAGAGIAGHRTAGLDRPAAYWYSRGVLRFDAIMSKELSGTIIFEIDALRWGQQTAGSVTQASMRNNMGAWATDQAAVEVKNVYIDFGLPYFGIPVPMTVRVGAIPFGVRPNMVLYTDGMGITGGINVDPVMIMPMWGKMLEGTDYAADDADMYGLHVNAKLGTFTVGGYGLNYNMNTYPLQYNSAVVVGTTTVASASYGYVIAGTQKADFWWLGAYVDGKAGPVNINFDFVYDRGKVESRQTPTAEDVKYRGWATRGKIDFPWRSSTLERSECMPLALTRAILQSAAFPGQLLPIPANRLQYAVVKSDPTWYRPVRNSRQVLKSRSLCIAASTHQQTEGQASPRLAIINRFPEVHLVEPGLPRLTAVSKPHPGTKLPSRDSTSAIQPNTETP